MRLAATALSLRLLATLAALSGCRDAEPATVDRKGFHVAPSGSRQGVGSTAEPWDLATALAHPDVLQAGDTIWLNGGTYRGSFKSTLTGEAGRPVVVRQRPGQRATIDGGLEVRGSHTVYWGFEVMNSDPDRVASDAGSDPADFKRPVGVVVHGPGTRLVNMIIHDASNGVGFWSTAVDAEVYGSIVYNNGWQGPDRGHGHGIYAQNREGTKRIVDNIIFQQYKDGLEVYGSSRAHLNGFHIEGNVSFFNGTLDRKPAGWDIFVGGGSSAKRITVIGNFTYRRDGRLSARFGYDPASINEDLTLTDNYFVGQTELINWRTITLTGNTFTGAQDLLIVRLPAHQQASGYTWHDNTFLADTTIPTEGADVPFQLFQETRRDAYDFDEWRTVTGLDDGSTAKQGRPSGSRVFVRPNQYEAGRAHIIVYNWDHAETVDVDVSGILRPGDRYEVRSVQDYFGTPIAAGTYGSRFRMPFTRAPRLRIPMHGIAPARPVGLERSPSSMTGPEFGVFVLIRRPANPERWASLARNLTGALAKNDKRTTHREVRGVVLPETLVQRQTAQRR